MSVLKSVLVPNASNWRYSQAVHIELDFALTEDKYA